MAKVWRLRLRFQIKTISRRKGAPHLAAQRILADHTAERESQTGSTGGAALPGEPNALEINDRIQIPLSEFEFVFSRASGPGGQNVNKVSSRVQLRWLISDSSALPADVADRFQRLNRRRINSDGVFQISSQRYRDQPHNKADCLEKLAAMLEEACHVPRQRKRTRVPRRAHERRLSDKKKRSESKQRRQKPGLQD